MKCNVAEQGCLFRLGIGKEISLRLTGIPQKNFHRDCVSQLDLTQFNMTENFAPQNFHLQ